MTSTFSTTLVFFSVNRTPLRDTSHHTVLCPWLVDFEVLNHPHKRTDGVQILSVRVDPALDRRWTGSDAGRYAVGEDRLTSEQTSVRSVVLWEQLTAGHCRICKDIPCHSSCLTHSSFVSNVCNFIKTNIYNTFT